LPTRDPVYVRYPLEDTEKGALYAADCKYKEIMELSRNALPKQIVDRIKADVPGILPKSLKN